MLEPISEEKGRRKEGKKKGKVRTVPFTIPKIPGLEKTQSPMMSDNKTLYIRHERILLLTHELFVKRINSTSL